LTGQCGCTTYVTNPIFKRNHIDIPGEEPDASELRVFCGWLQSKVFPT